jgi:hypothetical protein
MLRLRAEQGCRKTAQTVARGYMVYRVAHHRHVLCL